MAAPPPRVQLLLNRHWDAIVKAVKDGLGKPPAFDTALPISVISERRGDLHVAATGAPRLTVDLLDCPEIDPQPFVQFGQRARLQMWSAVLKKLVDRSRVSVPYKNPPDLSQLHGSGPVVIVVSDAEKETTAALKKNGDDTKIVELDKGYIPDNLAGVAFHSTDGPYLLIADYEIGWDFAPKGAATLKLDGRVLPRQFEHDIESDQPRVLRLLR